MTVFDYVFLGIVGVSAVVGLARGLVSEVLALVGWVLALVAAWKFVDDAALLLKDSIADPGWRSVAAFALIVLVVLLLMSFLRFLLRELLKVVGLRATDRFFGALFGVARGLAIAFVLVLLGGMVDMAREPWWAGALFAPPLEAAVLESRPWLPEVVAGRIHFR
ncbi:colicin V biosynthesis protein [Betaproteobacteria bacterium]|nr:colicin V biosynthesis protein [Betaproteobacteria bacterium]GHT97402.1 colicin V biosynthesis protein [Betaproteobacteria bacterium]GHU00435.1 colicin V biosynthesis protein [Betaproteobacteria bacterium]GHU18231.1 colicin V biosynthesis protein [Betaproteobacteria bacterium]GHU31102.1 colicin V biosynthesis protein [Betaproteobacteria bacterium]